MESKKKNFTGGAYREIQRPRIPDTFHYGEIVSWKFRESITPITRNHTFAYRFCLYFESGDFCNKEIGGFSSKMEALKAREITIFELQNRSYIPFEYTVQEFYSYYLYYYLPDEKHISYQTFCSYRNAIKYLFSYINPNTKLIKLNQEDIFKVLNAISSDKQKKNVSDIIKVSLNVAKTKHLIPYNPAIYAVKKIKLSMKSELQKKMKEGTISYERKVYPVLTVNEIGRLLLECKESEPDLYLPLLLGISSGCRISELIALTYDDIDIWNHEIHITKQLGRQIYNTEEAHRENRVISTEIPTKTKSGCRKIPLSDLAYEEILLARMRYEESKKTNPNFHDNNYICCKANGMPYHRGSFHAPFQQLLKKCNLPHMRWHDLRHTFATILNENEVNMKALALVMGHRDPTITKDVYINPKIEAVDCSMQVNRFLETINFQTSTVQNPILELPDYHVYLGNIWK